MIEKRASRIGRSRRWRAILNEKSWEPIGLGFEAERKREIVIYRYKDEKFSSKKEALSRADEYVSEYQTLS